MTDDRLTVAQIKHWKNSGQLPAWARQEHVGDLILAQSELMGRMADTLSSDLQYVSDENDWAKRCRALLAERDKLEGK